ncbi:UNVERIFIED_CONTAM: Cytokine-like protein 1 [Gekko kuhli]
MRCLLGLTVLFGAFLLIRSAPPTCYSRVLSLGKEITESYVNLLKFETVEPCVKTLPRLYLDIHNYCVLAKLREFVAYPRCRRVPQVTALKDKARSLYTIMTSFCRRDLVFLSEDCNALEIPMLSPTYPSAIQK